MKALTFVILFIGSSFLASSVSAANVYIDPGCPNPGDGSTGVCDGTSSDNPRSSWSGISFNIANDYYQKCGTKWTTTSYLEISNRNANQENRMVLGAYYLNNGIEVLGVKGNKPILEETSYDTYLFVLRNSDFLHITNLDIRGGRVTMTMTGGGVDYFLMENCDFGKNVRGFGIFSKPGLSIPNDYGVIRNCIFDSNIDNSGVIPADEGGTLTDGILLKYGHNFWEIYSNTFIDWPHGAVVISSVSASENPNNYEVAYNRIYNNLIYRNTNNANYFRGIGGLGDSLLHDNEFYRNYQKDMTVRSQFGGKNNRIYLNIIDTTTDSGVKLHDTGGGILLMGSEWNGYDYTAVGNKIYNNILYKTSAYGIGVGGGAGSMIKDNEIINNIIYECGNGYNGDHSKARGTGLEIASAYPNYRGNIYKNNIIFNSQYQDVVLYGLYENMETVVEFEYRNGVNGEVITGNRQLNPMFVDPDNGDFRLLPGSPAIDRGFDIGATSDYLGNPIVGAPDIGAYEYQEQAAPSAPTGLKITGPGSN